MTAATNRYPRHRPHPRGQRLHTMRLNVCGRAGWQCEDCGLVFNVPDGYDGSYALFLHIPRQRTASRPLPWKTIYLELGHVASWLDGGQFELANLRALCSPCNIKQGREARA